MMPGDRVTILAIVAVIFGLVAVVWGAWAIHKQLGREAPAANQQTNEAHSPAGTAHHDGVVLGSAPPLVLQSSTKREKESQPAADDLEAVHKRWWYLKPLKLSSNGWIALFTAGLFVVAFIQWLTIGQQASIMEDTLKQMERDSISQNGQFAAQLAVVEKQAVAAERASFANRAWLSVEFLEIGQPTETFEKGISEQLATIDVRLLVRNDGLTPARISSIESSLYVVPSDSLNPTDYEVLKIDPDNLAHSEFMVGQARSVSIADRTISAPVVDYQSSGGEIRQQVHVPGNGKAVPMEAQFIFAAPAALFYRDEGQLFPRFDYWLHVEIPYFDVYQTERRTCFFAHIDQKTALWADHISSVHHNYQR